VVLVAVTAAKALGVARPAWRLLVGHASNGAFDLLVSLAVLLVFASIGWWFRSRLPKSGRHRDRH
jgi:NSS family neurotransmitter:Na+ symporter